MIKQVKNHSILTVTLSRPDIHNAFDEHLIADLTEAFQAVSKDPDIAMVVLTGEGKSFSAGADLNWMRKMVDYSESENLRDATQLANMFSAISNCPVPVIARVHGSALGGGSGLVAACDLVFALGSASFGFTEVRLGLAPAVIAPWVLRRIGYAHASRYFLTGERFDASEARRIGLVHECFGSEEEMDERLEAVSRDLKKNSRAAMRSVKELLNRLCTPMPEQCSLITTSTIASLRVSEEGQEGLRAFLEKRTPAYCRK